MTAVSFVSTYALNSGLQTQVMRIQTELAKQQAEVSSGKVDDLGLAMGLSSGQTLSFDYGQSNLQAIIDSNQVTASRLDTTNQALTQLQSIAQDFSSKLTSAQTSGADPNVIVTQAKAALQSLLSTTSITFAGQYVFSGIQSDAQPIPNYPGTPPSAGKTAVDASFQAAFGMSQSDPGVNGITSANLQNYLSTSFSSLFDQNGWTANFYSGSSTTLTSRISSNETMSSSVTANDPGVSDLMQSLVMVSDLGAQAMNSDAFNTLLKQAANLTGKAQTEITSMQTRIGIMQSKTTNATADLTAQKDIMSTTLTKLTGVDSYQAAAQINQLTTQLQTAYSLTARMQDLSLLKFL